jgi:[ribosomal protein S18]-alanine N-acetyltransferase
MVAKIATGEIEDERDPIASAAALYRAAGFVSVGRRKNYYHGADGERFDAVTFVRDL